MEAFILSLLPTTKPEIKARSIPEVHSLSTVKTRPIRQSLLAPFDIFRKFSQDFDYIPQSRKISNLASFAPCGISNP